MFLTLTIYNVFQSLLFLIVIVVGKKVENKQIGVYFGYQLLIEFLFLSTNGYFGTIISENELVAILYIIVAFLKPLVIIYFH